MKTNFEQKRIHPKQNHDEVCISSTWQKTYIAWHTLYPYRSKWHRELHVSVKRLGVQMVLI